MSTTTPGGTTQTQAQPVRYAALDGLRGLASLAVLNMHVFGAFPFFYGAARTWGEKALKWWPFTLLSDGRQAVILFFCLSGFVLSLAWERENRYWVFLRRRFWRLYIPFSAAVLLALAVNRFHVPPSAGISAWGSQFWRVPLSWGQTVNTLLLVDPFRYNQVNPVFWSLTFEARLSLLFPVLFWVARRASAYSRGTWFLGAVLAAYVLDLLFPTKHLNNWADTLLYAIAFTVGIWLAGHRAQLQHLSRGWSRACLIGGLFAVGWQWDWIPGNWVIDARTSACLSALLGSILLLIWGMSGRDMGLLTSPPVRFLGRISYSLYLVHFPIAFSLLYLLWGKMPTVLLLTLMYGCVVLGAYVFWRSVERPATGRSRQIRGAPSSEAITPEAANQREGG
ncbi:acyltransferase [Alicyclobacillus sp. SP_1]|uniref:acyltransferase family protein n=1 Tax=Alicyclobacillus sp. SP_1 TaxID=2942475 RepID=UPI00215750FC|nr:acyltransferase [Alicyclobacillus sp. SP_1]